MTADKRLCSACAEGRHSDCGRQSWCECDCEKVDDDYGHDPDLDENNVCRVCGQYEAE